MTTVQKISLNTPVENLYMVGSVYAKRLKKLKIETLEDFLHHYPFRYIDFRLISSIAQVQAGEIVTVRGKIVSSENIYTLKGKKIQKIIVEDESGKIPAVWFNQPFLVKILKPGILVSLSGKVDYFGYQKSLINPEYELLSSSKKQETIHTGRFVPVYPETKGISSKWLRSRIAYLIKNLIPRLEDWLPQSIKQKNGLIDLKEALRKIHFPKNKTDIIEAKNRLAFDELFLLQLKTLLRKQEWQKTKLSHPFFIDQEKILTFIKNLPFNLTADQKKVCREILADLQKNTPMNRLLQGDVGSGKTVVATIALYVSFLNGYQAVLMAPTEILANQHYQTIKNLLTPFGVKTSLLTSSKKLALKQQDADVIIGTHALLYHQINWKKLGLVIIDEQHRFGVEQRAKLVKQGESPHLLTMTATPIPRTIALTVFGDLDLSIIEEMPPGRKITKTWVVPPQKRESAYRWIEKQILEQKTQAFIVCPLIEESESESFKNIKAVSQEFNRLSQKVFPHLKLGLLHGRLKTKEKEEVIRNFQKGKIDILVSTPVVEVGIDIPKATLMVIEGAERFGLAQLHQLRGRVGRSNYQSYCLLFVSEEKKSSLQRLKAMEKYHSGFKLAEIDLQLRGPGEIYGVKQHGFINLKIASFSDILMVEKTKKAAQEILSFIPQFPQLQEKIKSYKMNIIMPN